MNLELKVSRGEYADERENDKKDRTKRESVNLVLISLRPHI